jgi:hypothetical protein
MGAGHRVGRFMSMDPLAGSFANPQSLNRFSYATNDPINMVDPSGMAGGNWTCLLNEHGDCVGGDYSGLAWLDPMGMWGGSSNGMGGCSIDGQSLGCGMVSQVLKGGFGVECPFNTCVGQSLNNGLLSFVAYSDGSAGYKQLLPAPDPDLYDTNQIIEGQRQKVIAELVKQLCKPGDKQCEGKIEQNVTRDNNVGQQCLIGGNCNFLIGAGLLIDLSGCVPSGDTQRCGLAPSLHFEGEGLVHLDTINPYSLWGLGALGHFFVDVVLGNTIYSGGIPR